MTQDSRVTGVDVDRTKIEGSTSQQQTHISFSPSDAHFQQPGGVYTLTEVLGQMRDELNEQRRQLTQMWQKLILIERDLLSLKDNEAKRHEMDSQQQTRAERQRALTWLVWFRFFTVVALAIIIIMLVWLFVRLGGI
jgi:hypothetical protein